MTQIQKTPRNSAIELLRLLAMGIIVLSHICCHSGYDSTYSMLTVNRLFVQFGYLGNLGVALFIMISGYFQSSFRIRSLSRLLSQVWFYSVSLFLICRFGFGYAYTKEMLWQVFLPTIYNEYWFFTAYVVFFLLTPFVNAMIRALTREQLRTMLAVMTLLWVLIPTLTKQQLYAAELPQFLMYYLLGAYLRLYPGNRMGHKGLSWAVTLGSFGILFGLTVVLGYLERYTPEVFGVSQRFYDRNSLLILGAALGLFSLAVNSKPFTSNFINAVGGCTFGVYLIHDNPAVRALLWKDWLHWGDYFTSGSFIPRLVLSILLVYLVCTGIEWLRLKTVAKPMEQAVDSVLSRLLKNTPFV
jgi:surface polysaccharide O-acyltransferase-like enzyme